MLTKEECMDALNKMINTSYSRWYRSQGKTAKPYFLDGFHKNPVYKGDYKALKVIEKLIKEHFESKEDISEFKNFKLHANSTLKCMSKDELISYIHMLYSNCNVACEQLFNVIKINKKLQDELDAIKNPQPYKFEELKKGMWVWDDENEMFILITFIDKQFKKMNVCLTEYDGFNDEYVNVEYTEYFEEGRFFPVTKALEYQNES